MPDMKIAKGVSVLVDDEDYERLLPYKWYLNERGYVIASVYPGSNRQVNLQLHRMVLNNPQNAIDHINHNLLDNRRCNLRLATMTENARNRKIYRTNKSGFKGVSKRNNRWRAGIEVNKKGIHLGYFSNPRDAHSAYCKAAKIYFGDFACFG